MKRCTLGVCARGKRLGTGSSADVWEVRRGDKMVAVKLYRPHGQALALVRQEARAARLDHPNIARILGGGVGGGYLDGQPVPPDQPYIVQELVQDARPVGDVLAWARLKAILRGVLLALEHAHGRGLLHRDIKPANVLVRGDAWATQVKLVDWGLCWDMRPMARNAFRGLAAGTPRYMPLEQVLGQRDRFGPWSDLFALGCLAHRMATGFAPLRDEATTQGVLARHERTALLRAKLPKEIRTDEWGQPFADWVGWLISIPIADRPQTAREALDALEVIPCEGDIDCATGEPVRAVGQQMGLGL